MTQTRVAFDAPDLPRFGGGSLEDFIAELQAVLETVPAQHRGAVTIEFSAFDDYGSPAPSCEIELLRDATPEEEAKQKAEALAAAKRYAMTAERNAAEAKARLEKLAQS